MGKYLIALAAAFACSGASADTIYLCKAYSGGKFWSAEHCSTRSALIERMADVPAGLPFDQQVDIANGARIEAARVTRAANTGGGGGPSAVSIQQDKKERCAALDRRIANLDAQARQSSTNAIAAQRQAARDRQAELRC